MTKRNNSDTINNTTSSISSNGSCSVPVLEGATNSNSRLLRDGLMNTRIVQSCVSDDSSTFRHKNNNNKLPKGILKTLCPSKSIVASSNKLRSSSSSSLPQLVVCCSRNSFDSSLNPTNKIQKSLRFLVDDSNILRGRETTTTTTTMRMQKSRLLTASTTTTRERTWEELEDNLLIQLDGNMAHLKEFETLHKLGIRRTDLLYSLAYLCTKPNNKRINESVYYEHVSSIALYLSIGRSPRFFKLALLKTLMVCLSPPEAAWQTRDAVIEVTFQFLTRRRAQWEYLQHSESILLWEIRAMGLYQIERERQRIERVASTGDSAAIIISTGAKLVETGMARSVPVISNHIDNAGKRVKGCIKTDDYPLIMDRNAVVALAYSDAARRASEGARDGTRLAIGGIRNISSKGLQMVAQQFDGSMAESLPPEGAEVLKAAGKVGMATLGAAVIVGEAMVESSRAVIQKTAGVTADVVRHKYGESAGQVVTDAGETTANILRALGNVAMLEGQTIASSATSATRDAGKTHVNGEFTRARDSIRLLEEQALGMVKHSLQMAADGSSPHVIKRQATASPQSESALVRGQSQDGIGRKGKLASSHKDSSFDGIESTCNQMETKKAASESADVENKPLASEVGLDEEASCILATKDPNNPGTEDSGNAEADCKHISDSPLEESTEYSHVADNEMPQPQIEHAPISPTSQRTASTLQETEGSESSLEEDDIPFPLPSGRSSANNRKSKHLVRIGRRGNRSKKKRIPLIPNMDQPKRCTVSQRKKKDVFKLVTISTGKETKQSTDAMIDGFPAVVYT